MIAILKRVSLIESAGGLVYFKNVFDYLHITDAGICMNKTKWQIDIIGQDVPTKYIVKVLIVVLFKYKMSQEEYDGYCPTDRLRTNR